MRSKTMQVGGTAALMLAGVGLAAVFMAAQTPAQTPPTDSGIRFTATTDNVVGAHDAIRIDLSRWSTDVERNQVLSAWTQAVARAAALKASGRGGASGPAAGGSGNRVKVVVPGVSKISILANKVSNKAGKQMPPNGPLPDEDIALIVGWIERGASAADFAKDVQPILNANCLGCHAGNNPKAGLRLDTLENVMDGGNDLGDNGAPDRLGLVTEGTASPLTPEGSLQAALEKAPTLGYLWASGVSGYAVHYAVRTAQPDGGERVILITDRRVGDQNDAWKPVGPGAPAKAAATEAAAENNYEFSVIELRLNSKGQGEGKISLTGKAAADAANKLIALENYGAQPVVLKNVARKEPKS